MFAEKSESVKGFLKCLFLSVVIAGCSKSDSGNTTIEPPPARLTITSWSVDGKSAQTGYTNISRTPLLRFQFSTPVSRSSVATGISLSLSSGVAVSYNTTYEKQDSVVVLTPAQPLAGLTRYNIDASAALKSIGGAGLSPQVNYSFVTGIDSTDKFSRITDDELLDKVQRQTFKFFWDFGHPVSGLARERNTSGDVVTSGGSGFGVMTMLVAVHRNFITRTEGLQRVQKMVDFLKTKAKTFHGAFPHWLNGATGAVVPFSTKDNGADLVETSYLMQGLLCARQYFNGSDAAETTLRNDINTLWNAVEWNWFRKGSENVLYWHWSPDYNWDMNMPIKGWNECLITYVLAASSPNYAVPKTVYDAGWASNGAMRNGNTYYGVQLPLGPAYGGPLFFAHYSFLSINPTNLTDSYANYWDQNKSHTLINYNHCRLNPKGFFGYSDSNWGLTASDDNKVGYLAHDPVNDDGVISPTAALSSFPYTPTESMKALQFFYYKLGDKLFKDYGFIDAFNLTDLWFPDSYLAIDQGPIIIMIENHRSGLLWNLFMSCPEVKTGMKNLGFQSPNL